MLIHPFVNALGGSDPQVHGNACDYLRWTVIVGGVGTSLNALLGHLVRSEGRSMQAGFGIALGGVLNIALDPLFMFVILKPGNEVAGAAIATMLSNLTATLYFLAVIWANRDQSVLSLKPTRRALDNGIPADVLTTGLPACLMTLCENISYAVLDNLMASFGMMAQAGIGVAKKVNMLAHCMVRGMAQGVLPLIGYNYAAGQSPSHAAVRCLSTGISVALAAPAWPSACCSAAASSECSSSMNPRPWTTARPSCASSASADPSPPAPTPSSPSSRPPARAASPSCWPSSERGCWTFR